MSTKLQTVIKYCVVLIVIVHWTACALKLVTEYTLNECSWDDCPQTILTSTSNYRDGIWAQYVEAAVWALVAINGEASTRTHGEGVLGLLVASLRPVAFARIGPESKNKAPTASSDGGESHRWRHLARRPRQHAKPPRRSCPWVLLSWRS